MKIHLLATALTLASLSAIAGNTVIVHGNGSSEFCYKEDHATELAYNESRSKAREECTKLGGKFTSQRISNGNFSIKACSGSENGNYKAKVTGVEYTCTLKN